MDWPRKRKQSATLTASIFRFDSRPCRNHKYERDVSARFEFLQPTRLKRSRLDFAASFYLDRAMGMPAGDDVTSSSANDQRGVIVFATTHWSLVLEAQGESTVAKEALEKLCRIYWRPVYSFLRGQGIGQE